MKELNVFELCEDIEEKNIDDFFEKLDSKFNLNVESKYMNLDIEWIEKIEDTIRYIENIFKNPNRFIVNEEDIVKIELARKITVDSIKHLSKNTNLIQDYDKQTGDVRPSSILNINKEESYDTYENRLVYTLIQNLKVFIMKKKSYLKNPKESKDKYSKELKYYANSNLLGENIDIKIEMNSNVDKMEEAISEYEKTMEKIAILERKITDITSSEVYKILDKKHFALVTPPIKKTNVILKNVNFQYVMKLWNYLQDNLENKTIQIESKENFEDNEEIHKLLDETFLLNYLVTTKLNNSDGENKEQEELTRQALTNQLIEKLISLNSDLTQEEILKMIGIKYNLATEKTAAKFKDIKDIFEKHINKYLERMN